MSNQKKIVIVGGVAGGATAAARLRRLDETSHIVLFERGEHISFANCGLPYHIGNVIPKRESLLVQTAEGMSKKFNLDIRPLNEVTGIDRERKVVTVRNVKTGENYEESYDELILSPGAKPIVPPVEGLSEAKYVFTLRNIPDTDRIKQFVDEAGPKQALIVGGGFIGLEMAENLHLRGIQVTIVEMADQVMAPLDPEMAAIVHQHLRDKGVRLILNDGLSSFMEEGRKIKLGSGRTLETDMTILSIGVRPENELAKAAGLALGSRGGIMVNEQLRTEDPHIWAIGDAIEVKDYIQQTPAMIPLAWPANRQGRLVADHIYGKGRPYRGTLGTSVAKVFDLTVAVTGNNEKTLKRLEAAYEAVHIHPASHASYYPGGFPVSLKMTFNKETGEIYGVQGVGMNGVEKRIDVIATAIKGKLTVHDLPDLELAYAPPYSSAKDPVNMLGYVASNVADGVLDVVHYDHIDELIRNGATLVDVREPVERESGFIAGSINIPLGELRSRLHDLPGSEPIYVSCQVGLRGYLAARILEQNGFKAINLSGGYKTYSMYFGKQSPEEAQGQHGPGSSTSQAASDTEPPQLEFSGELQSRYQLDVCGLQCPGPISQVYQVMQKAEEGDVIEVSVTDPAFPQDIAAWCGKTGNMLLKQVMEKDNIRVWLQKGRSAESQAAASSSEPEGEKGATLVVFNQDLDKAIASFIIATGAASMGKKVTMFFTFWGLNILRKANAPRLDKDFMDRMFGKMMPQGPDALPISNMNMAGMGAQMIKRVMKKKNVDSLETLMRNAMDLGVELVACSMSMDVMGIQAEEMIDGVTIGGVATYLGKAEDANLNLFV
ncbi:CoA-disulfide reductase [Paenibacillus profundus]|uniref:CoA-disulfide reductase n=1 Tax=Paenibacillus profundus TaxID=1173085 RepID=A0ABS8YA36_9BACL|nr:CoA-disulfide reductase [Paenibacillus profundus]MCE5168212.1 CoA-disulfide reductase [Paenibacillus profundus]